jgi:DNA-binding CsgD family transcriptional regulator
MDEFLIKYHPWKMLREALSPSFPDERQLTDMKKVLDGNSNTLSKYAREGMKVAGIRNLYELVVWGLRTGVIKDEPIKGVAEKFPQRAGTHEAYPAWLVLLHNTTMGMSDDQIQRHGISRDTINNFRKQIQDKFGLGNSMAKFIRFAFAATNPIGGPGSTRGFKPHVPWTVKAGVGSKYPIIQSKFRPANIDPNIPVYDRPAKTELGDEPTPKINLPKRTVPVKPEDRPKPIFRTTPIQTALWMLGIDRSAITGQGVFWRRPPEELWALLELAKKRFGYEIAHAHPDRGGNTKRAAQLTSAWILTKKLFAKHGYILHGK